MRTFLFFALTLMFSCFAFAEEPHDPSKSTPTTKIEIFSARTGSVIIKGFKTIGTIGHLGTATIDAREFRDASNPKLCEYGISIHVKETGRIELENTSYIDYDEIESLINGIDYISHIDKSVTAFDDFEAIYRTKGDLYIVTFSSQGGMSFAISSGRIRKSTAFLKFQDVGRFKALVVEAKSYIDKVRFNTK